MLKGSYCALVVDDNRYMAQLVVGMLRQSGLRSVRRAADADEVLAILRTDKIDVILCDLDVRSSGGIGILLRVRNPEESANIRIPVIMMCEGASVEELRVARDCGATEFVAKPVSQAALVRALHAALERKRPFIESERYIGPDRRRRHQNPDQERRRAANRGDTEN